MTLRRQRKSGERRAAPSLVAPGRIIIKLSHHTSMKTSAPKRRTFDYKRKHAADGYNKPGRLQELLCLIKSFKYATAGLLIQSAPGISIERPAFPAKSSTANSGLFSHISSTRAGNGLGLS